MLPMIPIWVFLNWKVEQSSRPLRGAAVGERSRLFRLYTDRVGMEPLQGKARNLSPNAVAARWGESGSQL